MDQQAGAQNNDVVQGQGGERMISIHVGLNAPEVVRFCHLNQNLRAASPMLADLLENHPLDEPDLFWLHTSADAYDAAMSFITGEHLEFFEFPDDVAIDLLCFAKKYLKGLYEVALQHCVQLDFSAMASQDMLKLHYTFFYHGIWEGREDLENKLLDVMSDNGWTVLYAIEECRVPCLDSVKKILSLPSLNVFSEKDVYESVRDWKNDVFKSNDCYQWDDDRFGNFDERFEKEILTLIRFDFFTSKEISSFLDDRIIPLSIPQKLELLQKNKIATSKWDVTAEVSQRVPKLTLLTREFSRAGGLNFHYFFEWRGRFHPLTERTILLKPKTLDGEEGNRQTFCVRPLKGDLYLLQVRLFFLKYKKSRAGLTLFVNNADDGSNISMTGVPRSGGSTIRNLSNPCLLVKGRTYRMKLIVNDGQSDLQACVEADSVEHPYRDILHVSGNGNVCSITFAFAKNYFRQ